MWLFAPEKSILKSSFDCYVCKAKYCRKPDRKRALFHIDCICKIRGKKQCGLCNQGSIKLYTCPAVIPGDIERLLPYFYTWQHSSCTVFPDYRGLYYTDKRLYEAFNLLLEIKLHHEKPKD